ncbi:dna repair enzyme [Nannochloropsis gaditana]|uniref:Dna repair enzyme n=1 Tax=Nannochloropsis gaditana TaxID=72520 RepID=W7TX36_9STRA|nr:dna repair enzyme [Nannochloropsis gaditana]
MGVHNLWQLLLPVGRRVNVESLERKTLAIDVSIWLTQFIKAMRDDEGKVVKNAHIIGTFRRIVKLLFYRIRPIFVFDGGTPEIKRRTVMSRKRRREDQETSVRKTAQRLLLAQLKKQHILSGSTVLTGASGKNKKQKADLEPVGSLGAEAGFAAGFIPGAPEKAWDPPDAEVAGREEFVAGDGSQDARKGAEKVDGHGINGDGGSIRQRSAAAAFAQALPAAASDEEEEVEWEEEEDSGTDDVGDILLEDDNVDVMVLASLPPELQKDVVESAKRRQRMLSRQAFMPVAGNPALYSQAQISNFLKSSRLNQKVSSLREVLGDDGNRDEGGIGAGGKDQPESSAGSGTWQGTEEYEDMSRDLDDEAALRSRMRKELRDAETVSQEMREDIMHLLQLFGVPYLVAPMEAEAQCAVLETLGLVDGVVSDDSDSFLFGARAVYKNIFDERKYVEAYRAEDLERELGLKRVDLVSLALLLGSDYTEGVKGVGIVNAMEVVRAFAPREEGEGETEVRGGKPEEGLQHFKAWLDGFDPLGDLSLRADRKLVDDREEDEAVDKAGEEGGSTRRRAAWVTQEVEAFHSKHKSARTRWVVTERFPDPAIYRAYLQPQVNASTDSFTWGVPDLDGLRVHLAQKLGWPVSETDSHLLPMLRRMQETVWQSRLDSYFLGYQDNVKFAKIKSKRLQRAVADLKPGGSIALEKEENTESGQEGAETMEIENARKNRKGSRQGGNARLCEGTNADVNRKEAQRTKALSPSKKMRRVQKRKKSLGQCSSSSGGSSSDEGEEREEGSVKGNGRGIAEADTRVPARLRGRRGGRGRKVVILDDEEASGSEHMAEE